MPLLKPLGYFVNNQPIAKIVALKWGPDKSHYIVVYTEWEV